MSHYFTNDDTPSAPKRITCEFDGREYVFDTDAGMFSPNGADDASLFMISSLPDDIGGDMLDLGCGYGTVGIIMYHVFRDIASVTFTDVNERALDCARKNAAANGLPKDKFSVIRSDAYDGISDRRFDIVMLNPPIHAGKQVMYGMYEQTAAHLKTGGRLYVVIRQKHGAPSTLARLRGIYRSTEVIRKSKGIYVIECR